MQETMQQIKHRHIELPKDKRVIAISDIHGHYSLFRELLENINFSKDDILFLVGDIIEKGPESLKTLRYIIELCKNYTVYPVLGNVDAHRTINILDESDEANKTTIKIINLGKSYWNGCFFMDLCNELQIDINSEPDIIAAKKQIKEHFKRELDFFLSLPTLIETEDFIFVHGGLPTNDISRLNDYSSFDLMKNDNFINKGLHFDKYLLVGHWPTILYSEYFPMLSPYINTTQKIISIDGGCGIKQAGQLNAFIISPCHTAKETSWKSDFLTTPITINGYELSYKCYDELAIAYAKNHQEEAVNSKYIKWIDNEIKMIDKGEEFSRVLHISSGNEIEMHNSFIYESNSSMRCSDFTDYKLKVSPGDKLSIISQNSRGYFIKKDSVLGWYYGEMEN